MRWCLLVSSGRHRSTRPLVLYALVQRLTGTQSALPRARQGGDRWFCLNRRAWSCVIPWHRGGLGRDGVQPLNQVGQLAGKIFIAVRGLGGRLASSPLMHAAEELRAK